MIRLQQFDSDYLVPVLSGLLSEETTADSYILLTNFLKIFPPEEAIQSSYLIMSCLEQYNKIYTRTDLTPAITKESIMDMIQNNIYEEIKENKFAGFKQYASSVCQVELDILNDEIIGIVEESLLESVEAILDAALELDYSVNRSSGELINFTTNYKHSLLREAGSLLKLISSSDMITVRSSFWGWSWFLYKHRINKMQDASRLLSLLADTLRVKDNWSYNISKPLTSVDDIIPLEELYIENLEPIMTTPFEIFDQILQIRKAEITVLTANKGTGKTTFASMLAGIALAQNLKVMFYSPETSSHKMFIENIPLAYIRAKYGFAVTSAQFIGMEEPYMAGSEYTPEEKKVIIKIAKNEIANSGNYFHVDKYYHYRTFEEDIRADVKMFRPDIIFIDHTQELRGDESQNEKTSKLATVSKDLTKDYGCHIFMLSHPGSKFNDALPTPEKPVSNMTRISAWSQDVETLADNIMGAVKTQDDQFKIFFTKLRNGTIPPMYQVFRLIKPQGWFDYRKEDQFKQTVDTQTHLEKLLNGETLLIEGVNYGEIDKDEFDDTDGF